MMTHADVIEGAANCGRDPRNLHATAHTHTHGHTHTHTHTQLHTHTQAKAKAKAHAHTHTHTHTRTTDVMEGAAHCGRSPRKLAYTFGGGEEAVLEEEAV
jgi:hypothetical protein